MSDKIYDVPSAWAQRAFVDADFYAAMYKQSVENPEGFWTEHGKRIHWFEPYTRVKNTRSNRATSPSSGSRMALPTSPITAWTGIWSAGAIRWPSSGKATIRPSRAPSPIANSPPR